MDNLPKWLGADTVYRRAGAIAAALNSAAYAVQKGTAKGRRFRFSPCGDARFVIAAMNVGDEEALKALAGQYKDLWV